MAEPTPTPQANSANALLDVLKAALSNQPAAQSASSRSTTYNQPFDKTKATNYVIDAFKRNLHRVATQADIDYWVPRLINAQKKAPTRQVVTTDANGNSVVTTVSGIGDETQWLDTRIQSSKKYKPEYQAIQKQLSSGSLQALNAIAYANGLDLAKDFGQETIKNWISRINAGESPTVFEAVIRDTAKRGQTPDVIKLLDQGVNLDAVYSPYKNVMASTLEIDPNSITVNDPVLRSAITPQGEMTIYDFQRQLRKDPRWQYTNNAREEVSNSVQKVLKDFGFMG